MHKFDPKHIEKLESTKRKALLPAEDTLIRFNLSKEMTVADIGSGSGYLTFPAAKIVGEKGFVWSLDISQEMLDYQRSIIEKSNTLNIELVLTDESELVIDNDIIDFGILSMVLHEVKNKKAFLVELRRVIKAKGKLLIIEWLYKDTQMGPKIEERLSIETIEKLLKEQGFVISKMEEINDNFIGVLAEKK